MRLRLLFAVLSAGLLLLGGSGCDAVEPGGEPLLVVEGFLDAGKPLPALMLRTTAPLGQPYPDDATTAAAGAEVLLLLDGRSVPYEPDAQRPGRYVPATDVAHTVPSRARFDLTVQWQRQRASAAGSIPPPIQIDSIYVDVPDTPVEAVLLDSLYLTDSLGVAVQKGFIYPIEVTLWWADDGLHAAADSAYWIQTRLKPYTPFSSTIVNFFLRPQQILRERSLPVDTYGRRQWTGVYAIPVEAADEPLPPHYVGVALLRSGQDYARFAASRDAPERREPISNVRGGLGIVAGVSVDSTNVRVQ